MILIIIEGPDGSGKSTLARRLSYDFRLPLRHILWPPDSKDGYAYYSDLLDKVVEEGGGILDRFARSEILYGPLLRGGSRVTPEAWLALCRRYRALGVREVLCYPAYDVCRRRWAPDEVIPSEAVLRRTYDAWRPHVGDVGFVFDDTRDGEHERLLAWLFPGRTS